MRSEVKTFEHRSIIDTTMTTIQHFHEEPQALSKLTPPPVGPKNLIQPKNESRSGANPLIFLLLCIGIRK